MVSAGKKYDPSTGCHRPKPSGIAASGSSFRLSARPIRDRAEHAARAFSLDGLYRVVMNRPSPPGFAANLATYRTDPGEAAYFSVRERVARFQEQQGQERTDSSPTRKGNALYYAKQARRWGDRDRERYWMEQYRELGGTRESAEQSIARGEPLGSLKGEDQARFRRTLGPEERAELRQAERWYRRTYRGLK